MLSKRERLEKTIAREPVDRIPVALWRHWPGDDQRPADFVRSVLAFQNKYDWDFIKVTPTSSFCIVDYGVEDRWVGSLEGTREYTRRAVHIPADWERLIALDPAHGSLAAQVEMLRLLKSGVDPNVPYLQTIFSPLAQAKNIAGGDVLLKHMRTDPQSLKAGLDTIMESTLRFLEALRDSGISGIFYAIQHASYALMSEDEYRVFGRPYDLAILNAVKEINKAWWFNMVHLHGDAPMFDLVADYPVESINWHDREAGPTLVSGKSKILGAVCGGLGRWDPVHNGTPADVLRQSQDAIAQTESRGLILSTGCVIMITSPTSNIQAVRDSVSLPA